MAFLCNGGMREASQGRHDEPHAAQWKIEVLQGRKSSGRVSTHSCEYEPLEQSDVEYSS